MTFVSSMFLSTFWPVILSLYSPCNAILAIKKGYQDYDNSTAIGANSFLELIKTSKIFVDNTPLITEILKFENLSMLIICPRKWGRTINLDMVKTFVELEVDQNGNPILPTSSSNKLKLFNNSQIIHDDGTIEELESPLLISQHASLIDQHLGQYPVIHVCFKDVIGNDYATIHSKLWCAIGRAYKQHQYLLNVLDTDNENQTADVRNFTDILRQRQSENIMSSIKFLSRLLHDHFKRKVFIFFDNYDTPVHNIILDPNFPELDVPLVFRDMDNLTGTTFERNNYMKYAVVMGTYQLTNKQWTNYTLEYIADRNRTVYEHFGITQKDVKALFVKHNVTDQLARLAHEWYNGFISIPTKQSLYNPWTIANFLRTKKILCYTFAENIDTHISREISLDCYKRNLVLELISKETILIEKRFTFTEFELSFIREWGSSFKPYITDQGYLTRLQHRSINELSPAKLPNNEMAYELSGWLISYIQKTYDVKPNLLQNAGFHLYNFITQLCSPQQLVYALHLLYKDCGPIIEDKKSSLEFYYNFTKEDPLQLVFDCVTLQMQRISKFKIQAYYKNTLKAHIVVFGKKMRRATIIELECDKNSAKEALNRAETYVGYLYYYLKVKIVQLVGISIKSSGVVQIMVKYMPNYPGRTTPPPSTTTMDPFTIYQV